MLYSIQHSRAVAWVVLGCGVVCWDVVWCGVVWCGVVWCGVVWCGVVCSHTQLAAAAQVGRSVTRCNVGDALLLCGSLRCQPALLDGHRVEGSETTRSTANERRDLACLPCLPACLPCLPARRRRPLPLMAARLPTWPGCFRGGSL